MSVRLFSALFFICLSISAWGDFGDQPLDWTQKDSDTFRDYAVRQLNAKGSIKNNYWAHYWLTQKIQQFQISELRITQAPQPILINNSTINAFALPGNLIGLHTGLWRFAQTEDEFLSVLAHEMGHISLDHFTRLSADRAQKGWIIASGIVLSMLLASENPDAANATLLSSFAAASQQALSFSQAMELEADQFGQNLLGQHGYNTQAGRHFFARLDQQTFANTQTEFLRSHPLGSTRSAKLGATSAGSTQASIPGVFDLINFLVLDQDQNQTKHHLEQWSKALDNQMPLPSIATTNNPHHDYALSLFRYQTSGSDTQLLAELSVLIDNYPNFYPGWLTALKVALQMKHDSSCQLWQTMPKEILNTPLSLDALETVSLASGLCQPTAAAQWQATYYWQSGQEEKALALLRNALGKEQNTNQLARLKSQLIKFNDLYDRLR
jgi:predicted Zn-dependent protease